MRIVLLIIVLAALVHVIETTKGKFSLTFDVVHHHKEADRPTYDKYLYSREFNKCLSTTKSQINSAEACAEMAMNVSVK